MSVAVEQRKSSGPLRLAAIDVGSNSTHMLVVEMNAQGHYQILENQKEQTRLAADIDERLMLDANALSKMSTVLRRMKDVAMRHGAIIRCIATHPLREARNGVEFANRLSARVGVPVEIVSGQEEARLVSLGVRAGLSINDKSSLIVDVGGGSAEIVLCQWNEVRYATSLKLGAVRLTQKFLFSDPFSESELRELESYVRSRLEPLSHELRRFGFDLAVGSSGTIKALKALANGIAGVSQPGSFHGATLSRDELDAVAAVLFKNRSVQERRMLPGMDAKRADIIVAGAMVLRVLAEVAGVSSYTISTSALREGILFDTLAREAQWLRGDSKDVRWQSVREFGQRLRIDEPHAYHMATLTMSLFDALPLQGEDVTRWRELLRCAAYLHECGKFINLSGFHKHAQYLIKNSSLLGFSQRELEIVAVLVRFHRKRTPRPDDDVFEGLEKSDQVWVTRLASVLRLAVSLDRGRIGRIRKVKLGSPRVGKMVLSVSVALDSDPSVELYDVECEKGPFEKAFSTVLEVCLEEVSA
jgi:exopolyphosphatase/guanosine-5'-triphosphate,3'-diphosphate pyrophosphatase